MKCLYNLCSRGILLVLLLSSCSQWLDVKPEDKVMEDDLLTDETGFNTALNGIYLNMAARDVYGRELSCGYIEVLAQMYKIVQQTTGTSNEYLFFTQYNYTDSGVKNYFDRTWKAMYAIISGCNNLIEQAALRKNLFASEENYNSYISELYALRAFLHFDIFRLWGPVYSDATKGEKCIPYYKGRVSLPEPLSTAEEVVQYVLADLDMADSLAPAGNKTLKMNFSSYAIKALRARVYLYAGDKEAAYKQALELYKENILSVFPFVEQSDVKVTTNPDRLFYTEQIFLLENSKREKLYDDMFDYMLSDIYFLAPSVDIQKKLYSNNNDYRLSWWESQPGNGKEVAFLKFAKITDNVNPVRTRAQSLLKVSEILLILAECAPDKDLQVDYLDELRVGRGYQQGSVTDAEKNDWQATIQEEYHREFYGEGQYFFYLKRNKVAAIMDAEGKELTMGSAQYVIPLPDSESQYR